MSFAFDFDIGFGHFPRIEGLSIFLFPEMIEDFTVFLYPAINSGMTNVNPTIIKEFLDFTIAQIVTKIIAYSDNNDVFLELFAFKMIHPYVLAVFLSHFTLK
jgi:hypothetical protein